METEGTDDSGPHVAGVRQDAADGKHVCPRVMGPPFIQGQAQVPQTLCHPDFADQFPPLVASLLGAHAVLCPLTSARAVTSGTVSTFGPFRRLCKT